MIFTGNDGKVRVVIMGGILRCHSARNVTPWEVIAHDVEGLEHHVSAETFAAIEALSRYLGKHPEVSANLRRG